MVYDGGSREVEGMSFLESVSEGNQLWLFGNIRIMCYGMAITLWIWFLSIIF